MPGKFLWVLEGTHSILRNTASAQIPEGRALEQVHTACASSLLLVCMIRQALWFWRCQWWQRCSRVYGQPHLEQPNAGPRGSERSPNHAQQRNIHFLQTIKTSRVDDWGRGSLEWRVREGQWWISVARTVVCVRKKDPLECWRATQISLLERTCLWTVKNAASWQP